jgi:hypothetical protein
MVAAPLPWRGLIEAGAGSITVEGEDLRNVDPILPGD